MPGQNCKSYRVLTIPTKSNNITYPFQITEYDPSLSGAEPEDYGSSSGGAFYMVRTGDCFRTFSYDRKHLVNIVGINSGFSLKENEKVYIDFTILGNLQVSGDAFIKCGKVGKDPSEEGGEGEERKASKDGGAKNVLDPGYWIDYPSMFRLVPEDELDENGYIKKRADYQRQSKCYLLLGMRSDDSQFSSSGTVSTPSQSESLGDFSIVQKANSNIIMMASQHRGTPVCFPMPWHGGANPSGVIVGSSPIF